MPEPVAIGAKIKVRITEILGKGKCPLGHEVGEEFSLPEDAGRLCQAALHVIHPYARVLQFGGDFPWEIRKDNSGRARICCPDPDNPVVFVLERVE
jgi:uncharacterized repeat protein (TIGR04076 family)